VPRPLKFAATSGCIVLAVAALLAGYAAVALRHVQPFYASAINVAPRDLASASREMESRVAVLYSGAKPPGRWQAAFTDEEVNGWLAVTLVEKFPELLPPEVTRPRVAFVEGGVLIGFQWRGERLEAVISVKADARMADDDVLAVRLRQVRAGSLPLPTSDVVEQVSLAAAQIEWPLRWAYEEGDPVALLPTRNVFSTELQERRLELIEIRKGELLLAGSTAPEGDDRVAAQTSAAAGR
jgi:hypothetical protein